MDRMCLNTAVCVQQPARKGNDDHGSGTESEDRRVHRGKQGAAAAGHCRAGGHRQRGGHPGRGRTLRQGPPCRTGQDAGAGSRHGTCHPQLRELHGLRRAGRCRSGKVSGHHLPCGRCAGGQRLDGRPLQDAHPGRLAAGPRRLGRQGPYGGCPVRPQVPQGAGL